jgi:hypothetical protein
MGEKANLAGYPVMVDSRLGDRQKKRVPSLA